MKYYINVWKMQNKNKKSIILGSLNWIAGEIIGGSKACILYHLIIAFYFLMTDFTVSFNSSFIWLHLSLTLLFLTLTHSLPHLAASAKANFYLECFFFSKTFYFSNKKPRRIYNLWPHSIFIRIVCCFILYLFLLVSFGF